MSSAKIAKLVAENRFKLSVDTIEPLEAFVREQEDESYDKDANLLLLKLYTLFPEKRDNEVIGIILAKSIMQLPSNDLQLCSYLISDAVQTQEPVSSMLQIADRLKMAQFCRFWAEAEKQNAFLSKVPGFYDKVRTYMVSSLLQTYESIEKESLQRFLNLEGEKFDELVAKMGWKKTMETVQFSRSLSEETETQNEAFESSINPRVIRWPFTAQHLK
jgi:hypothetical protein